MGSSRQRYREKRKAQRIDGGLKRRKGTISFIQTLRSNASFYVHGHLAGGTNPSLVEAMHFGKAVLAFDCDYNRSTTEDKALFFGDSEELRRLIESLDKTGAEKVGLDMLEIAKRRYTWRIVAGQYFTLLEK